MLLDADLLHFSHSKKSSRSSSPQTIYPKFKMGGYVLSARLLCLMLVLQILPSSSREVLTSMSEKGKKYAAAAAAGTPVGANENQIEDEPTSGYPIPGKISSQTTTEDPFSFGETDSG